MTGAEFHELNLEMFGHVNKAIEALQAIYEIPDEEVDADGPFEAVDEESARAFAVFQDLLTLQDELLDKILAVDPDFV